MVLKFKVLLLVWSADCFNDCVTTVKLITIIARYSTSAIDLSVPVSVNPRFRILALGTEVEKKTQISLLLQFFFFISLLLQFTASSIEVFRY